MRAIILFLLLCSFTTGHAQEDPRISTIDFVQILNDNKSEAMYYYQNNWKILREKAVESGYIDSFQILETPFSMEYPFHLMLITTYANKAQYENRELHFETLIAQQGGLRLMNEKKPADFRKNLFHKEMARHWD